MNEAIENGLQTVRLAMEKLEQSFETGDWEAIEGLLNLRNQCVERELTEQLDKTLWEAGRRLLEDLKNQDARLEEAVKKLRSESAAELRKINNRQKIVEAYKT